MPQIKVSITETIEVPEGFDIQYAPTGIAKGFAVPGVGFFKPWITLEHFEGNDDSNDAEGDMSRIDLQSVGIEQSLTFEREIEVVSDEDEGIPSSSGITAPLGWRSSTPEVRGCTAKSVAKIGVVGLLGNITDDAELAVIEKHKERIAEAVLSSMGIDPLSRAA
ncbi:hypothetical protein [Erythrobacter aureus]|uniref:Uncharacterized protein n=1 Tax=Erythrobacter aureus TaxID=2182384 RepID=A0A345YJA8_9SPHN|nr:hypothetical protein [Erythrobacter aureus]AXK44010.1 hypothetical protein DVR09_16280 [Erythrobacter aureus]